MNIEQALKLMPKAKDIEKASKKKLAEISSKSVIVEEKYDGHCIILIRQKDGFITAWTRTGEDMTTKLAYWLKNLYLPKDTAVCGELISTEGRPASELPSIIKREGSVKFMGWHVLQVKGLTISDDWQHQQDSAIFVDSCWDSCRPYAEMCESYCEVNISIVELIDEAIVYGREGYIIKESPLSGWWKVKPTFTVDLVVKGVVEGKGRLAGTLGALVCGFHDDREWSVNVGGGLTDDLRKSMWLQYREHSYLNGRPVIEVEFQAVQKNGLQFPRFVRVRQADDKRPEQCLKSQLEGIRRA